MRSRFWTWTLNNFTSQEEQVIAEAQGNDELGIVYLIFGRECGERGTPHLQGYTIFRAPISLATAKGRIGSSRLHLEPSKGSPQQNVDYCKKDGDFDAFGDLPESNQGRRSDLEAVFHWADELAQVQGRPCTMVELCRAHPVPAAKYPRLLEIIQQRFEPPPLQEGQPREWQERLAEELDGVADDRTVRFIVDPEGGKGKSWFVRWYLSNNAGIVQKFSVSKRDDIAHGVQIQTKVFFIDVPRGQMEYLNYSIMEMMKDRLIWSPKYQSTSKQLLNKVHVVVFSNEHPDMDKLTADRYAITELS